MSGSGLLYSVRYLGGCCWLIALAALTSLLVASIAWDFQHHGPSAQRKNFASARACSILPPPAWASRLWHRSRTRRIHEAPLWLISPPAHDLSHCPRRRGRESVSPTRPHRPGPESRNWSILRRSRIALQLYNNMSCSSMHPRVECFTDSGRLMQETPNDPSNDRTLGTYLS